MYVRIYVCTYICTYSIYNSRWPSLPICVCMNMSLYMYTHKHGANSTCNIRHTWYMPFPQDTSTKCRDWPPVVRDVARFQRRIHTAASDCRWCCSTRTCVYAICLLCSLANFRCVCARVCASMCASMCVGICAYLSTHICICAYIYNSLHLSVTSPRPGVSCLAAWWSW